MKSHAARGTDVVDGDDVGVVEGASGFGFLDKTLFPGGIGDLVGEQDLNRHRAVQVGVAGFVDYAHAALPELGFDAIVAECPADHQKAALAVHLKESSRVSQCEQG